MIEALSKTPEIQVLAEQLKETQTTKEEHDETQA
jgi:hypothetical protein